MIEVRGYVLAPSDQVPAAAIGYAVPIFARRADVERFCPALTARIGFAGALTGATPLRVTTYGQIEDIAPFVWPVTSWSAPAPYDCAHLVAQYNISGAQVFLRKARQAIASNGGSIDVAAEPGPFIMTARRNCNGVMLYDLSQAPPEDYDAWVGKAITELSGPRDCHAMIVEPTFRDKVRAFVFASVPSFNGILKVLIPGYNPATASN
jgi:hypothetical protein